MLTGVHSCGENISNYNFPLCTAVYFQIQKKKKKREREMFKWFFPEAATLSDQQRQIFALAKGRGPWEKVL